MAQAAIAANLDQALDIELHLSAQIAFDFVTLPDVIAQQSHFSIGQVFDARVRTNPGLSQDFLARGKPMPYI